MGEAKRRKASGHNPHALAKRLVAAWECESDELEGDVFDIIVRGHNPNQVFEAATDSVPDEDRLDFAADIYDTAGALDPVFCLTDGQEVDGRLDLFTIALHGADTAINGLVTSPEAFAKLAHLIKACGYAHQSSDVVLVPLAIDPVSAATAGPADVRRMAEALLRAATNEDDDPVGAVRRILDVRPFSPTPGQVTIADRLLIGARLLACDDSETRDLFDDAEVPDADDETGQADEILVQHERARVDARCRVIGDMEGLFAEHGLLVMGDGPAKWIEGLGLLAIHRVKGFLAISSGSKYIELAGDEVDHRL